MTNKDIYINFIKDIQDFATTYNLEIVFENTTKDITNYPALQLNFIPNVPEFPTLGTNGQFYDEGIFQVMVIDEKNKGNGNALTIADNLITTFARNVYVNETNIKIIKSYAVTGFEKDELYNIPVSIEYRVWN